ncbi:MAG TPA: glycosyltransferase [Pyrinomonadaceae bacterium]|jgi:glycosyltransferase involved in cell wall biosynthesis
MPQSNHKINHTLYLCYFGLREPLVQTQVLPYLREIKKLGDLKISLLTFEPNMKEKWTDEQIESERAKLAGENINWYCLPYHKRPSAPATLYDVFRGALFSRRMIQRENVNVLHARVHTPAMMGAIAKKLSGGRAKMIFDIRGFFPEEYTDAGVWKENGRLYKTVKKIEKWLLKEADGFVVLTEKARSILFPESAETNFDKSNRPIEVIPCCVDLKRFESANEILRSETRRKYNLENRRVIAYVGSFGGWYMTDEMMDFFRVAKKHDESTFALILTQSNAEMISALLRERGYSENDFLIKKVSPAEIPLYLSASDAAISFIKACYSKQASSPTKIAEYLACGLPVISNSGVGDLDALIDGEKVGVIARGFTDDDYLRALDEINVLLNRENIKEENIKEHCRWVAYKYFDLNEIGGESYRKLYRRLLNGKTALD